MSFTGTMAELKAAGTAQNRKTYGRHGVRGKMFGVSYANLGKLAKRIKRDQPLAEKLWASGNHDARILATMIADPQEIRSGTIDAWARDLDSYPLADAFAGMVARTPFAPAKRRRWQRSRRDFLGQAGWNLLAIAAMKDESLSDDELAAELETIEARIGGAANRTRHSMNNALIAIGLRNAGLEKRAVAAARRIGPVEVDHGPTACKTPDAVEYIRRAKRRRK